MSGSGFEQPDAYEARELLNKSPCAFTHVMLAEDGGMRFLRDTAALGCPPDFLTSRCYPHESTVQETGKSQKSVVKRSN